MGSKSFKSLFAVAVSLFFCLPGITAAEIYELKGRVITQDENCKLEKDKGIPSVSVVASCEEGGPTAETDHDGNYKLKYKCGTCVNMLIYYQKKGFMPEKRRVRSDMASGSLLGDISMRQIKKYSDYRTDDIISLMLSIAEVSGWMIWRPSPVLKEVLASWTRDLSMIREDNGPSFKRVQKMYPMLLKEIKF